MSKAYFLFQEYKCNYENEILLNTNFNNFVRNYELAYWGPNTASHQIKSPYEVGKLSFQYQRIFLRMLP